jgi:hypothetical protein
MCTLVEHQALADIMQKASDIKYSSQLTALQSGVSYILIQGVFPNTLWTGGISFMMTGIVKSDLMRFPGLSSGR